MKYKIYDAEIDRLDNFRIYLNIKHLEAGEYKICVLHKKRLIKTFQFKKP